jgi:uncharacterized protein (TIGR02996 family)
MATRRSTASCWPGPQALAFLRDIIENPRDDARRLIFADWLDENDLADRAAIIRVQCELASMDEDNPRRADLVTRERELLDAYKKWWVQEIPTWARKYAWFQRGFIGEVHVTAAQWLKSGAGVREATPLERLILRNTIGFHLPVAASPLLAGLASLAVDHIGLDGLLILAESPHVASLESLNLDDSWFAVTGAEILAKSAHLANLRELSLTRTLIMDDGLAALARSPHLTRLTVLRVGNNNIGVDGARALAGSPTFGGLVELNMACSDPAVWRPDNGRRLEDAGIAALVASPHTPRLRGLHLRGQRITSAGAQALAAWPGLADLRVLDLHDNHIGPDGAVALAQSPHLGRLRHLNLGWNQIGDAGARALATSPQMASLTRLDVGHNGINEEAAQALLASPHLARLRWLDLIHNLIGHNIYIQVGNRFGSRPPGGL